MVSCELSGRGRDAWGESRTCSTRKACTEVIPCNMSAGTANCLSTARAATSTASKESAGGLSFDLSTDGPASAATPAPKQPMLSLSQDHDTVAPAQLRHVPAR
ncbi:MAG: hypothetical protein SGPRY_008978 [Prymnesium sp.]